MPASPPPCYLDDLGLADAPALYRLARDPAFFYAYLKENRQPVWLGTARFIMLALRLRLRRPRHWFKAVRSWPGDRLLGCVVLLDIGVLAPNVGEIAYFTAVSAQGHGITRAAVASAAHWARQHYGLRGLYASVDPANPASIAILERLGLSPIKFIPAGQSVFKDRAGAPRPCWVMQTTPQSFAAAMAALPAPYPVFSGNARPAPEQMKRLFPAHPPSRGGE